MKTGSMNSALNAVEGQALPPISIPLTFDLVAMTPFATWDFFPGHHNPDFARAQGQKDIYLNTVALQGFADRIVMEWAGPACFIRRRKMAMRQSAYPGDTLTIAGFVTERSATPGGKCRLILTIRLDVEAGRVCDVTTEIELGQDHE